MTPVPYMDAPLVSRRERAALLVEAADNLRTGWLKDFERPAMKPLHMKLGEALAAIRGESEGGK